MFAVRAHGYWLKRNAMLVHILTFLIAGVLAGYLIQISPLLMLDP